MTCRARRRAARAAASRSPALLVAYRRHGVGPAPAAADDDPVARVDAYLGSLKTLNAQFLQVVRGKEGQITDRATGTLAIARPNRFRWDYREPYSQTIVADGRKLWLYDPDLDQVTVRSLEQGLGATPAMLLSGSGKVARRLQGGGHRTARGSHLVSARTRSSRAPISSA